ncbi:xanthine dehydrogenase family protein molybdopterin-binding subunit [Chelatococcus asaccharovorans]|uniref:xanthine dehydrogenase family protein molybdopterin-binding subunit n=1 Tax=Chelatococcus asaccharovorans TaxID=28210 RepID=UPI00224C6F1D|nr:xanthine dehydrogenase family protein molybdopterin-binding subunit [Chelatococcus asaccharovorans]CAH1665432.1 Xanthine dehydrogenase molybdenum binding subunit apoprotein [Chelatococcus asaccharovorans]CAH1681959.1 Xanthine dehydrogenase molybdenum binding subunit apoprotein [Chelatococcus asaccharovorans]
MTARKFGIGQPARRLEDLRFITGVGTYTSDILPEGTAHAVVLRSPHAHARFSIADLATARAMPGVLMILTAADIAEIGDLQCLAGVKNHDGSPLNRTSYPVLARDVVLHVGDAVAFVVAETELQAQEAAESIVVDWEPLPAAVEIDASLAEGAPLVRPELGNNIAFETKIGDEAAIDAIFARADRVVSLDIVNNRLVSNYMETRACLAEYDRESGRWTITLGSQGSHDIRDNLAKNLLKVDPSRIRVITPDVGGGFGTKIFMYREYPLCAVAAERLGRPVRWVAGRGEHFLADTHGRANATRAEMALDKRGRFLGLKVDLRADIGAYLSQYAPYIPTEGIRMSPGCYDIPAFFGRVRGVYTNTTPVDAYRGAGRPEAAYMIERLVDHIARTIGSTPDKIRALNFIKPSAMPHRTQTGRLYDTGEFEGHMREAMEKADWAGFKDRLKASRRAGRLRGIGLATYIEACSGGGAEASTVSLEKDGSFKVAIGTQSNGQGHATAYAQIVSEYFDVPLDAVAVLQGDTDTVATGSGTGGSRSIPVGGAALARASDDLADKLKRLAAEALEAGVADLEIEGGRIRIAGTDRAMALSEVAALPSATPAAVTSAEAWTPPEPTYPNGSHICELEIDPDTGTVEIQRYTVVDDFGRAMNPLLLAGQVHGGAAQGIGQALLERTMFDADGQLITASMMDYGVPRADLIPSFSFSTRNVPSTTNALGMKGAGEAGAIGACPAVINAVVDALQRATGIMHIDMPATPDRIFAVLSEADVAAA